MTFSIKFTKGARSGKKLPILKRLAAEIYDARRQYEQKRTRNFQTGWMKDRPWLFHDKETRDRLNYEIVFEKMICLI